MNTYRGSKIESAQKYSSITCQLNAQNSSPTGEETRYPTNRSLGDWESGWVINVISYKMNKKSVTFSFFLSISSILTLISSPTLTFFPPFFCYQLILVFCCFTFDIHTFFLQGSMGLWWQHAPVSVIIIPCWGNTLLCIPSLVMAARLYVIIIPCSGNTLLCISSLVMAEHPYVGDYHSLLWQHAPGSLFIIACGVNTPLILCLSRLSCWVNRHISMNFVIYKI